MKFYACLIAGLIYLDGTNGTERVLPHHDPDLEADIIGEPLNPEDFAHAKTLPEEEDIEYNSTNRDPLENLGMEDTLLEGDINKFSYNDYTAVGGSDKRWPGGEIPYVISSSFDNNYRAIIAKAMDGLHAGTCITFIPVTAQDIPNVNNYIHIIGGNGCSAIVGKTGIKAQRVTLGKGCKRVGVVQHELLHAVGLWHEQSRPDRDGYISINYQNIMAGTQDNFRKMKLENFPEPLLKKPYDYGSIMHYGKYGFSKNNKPVLVTPNGQRIGQRNGASQMDLKKVNAWYGANCKAMLPKVGTSCPCTPDHSSVTCDKTSNTCVCSEAYYQQGDICLPRNDCLNKDTNKFCPSWARSGYCTTDKVNRRKYMLEKCSRSCGRCVPAPCFNTYTGKCSKWVAKGACTSARKYGSAKFGTWGEFMRNKCKLACGFCPEEYGCYNAFEDNCPKWEAQGFCTSSNPANVAFMKKKCALACGFCTAPVVPGE